MARTRTSSACAWRMASSVPSLLPSSMNKISNCPCAKSGMPPSTSLTRAMNGAMACSSSFTGTTIERMQSDITRQKLTDVRSAEHPLTVEHEGGEGRDEDRRNERPPGGPVHRPRKQPRERLVEQEPRELNEQEPDLHLMVFLASMAPEAPAAVEHESEGDRDEEGNHHRRYRRHHIGREIPVDGRINGGEEQSDEGEPRKLAKGLVTDV